MTLRLRYRVLKLRAARAGSWRAALARTGAFDIEPGE